MHVHYNLFINLALFQLTLIWVLGIGGEGGDLFDL